MNHIIHPSISGSSHQIVIHLIGVGGTGSHVLTNLAMMSQAMIHLERQPIFVRAFDYDDISESNIGRQNFSPADLGENKAKILIERINRFYGFEWESEPMKYIYFNKGAPMEPNIIISCVDSVKSRREIANVWYARQSAAYWLDIGNDARKAQIILGSSLLARKNSKKSRDLLPDFFAEYPGVKDDPNDTTPSCSAFESLNRQDLFINKIIATYATHMLWKLLKDFVIDYRGLYINLETMQINKILIK